MFQTQYFICVKQNICYVVNALSGGGLNTVFAMFLKHGWWCFKHIICDDLNTLFDMLHSSAILCVTHIICYGFNKLVAMSQAH